MPNKINLPPGLWTQEQKKDIAQELAGRIGGRLSGISRQLAGAEIVKVERTVEKRAAN